MRISRLEESAIALCIKNSGVKDLESLLALFPEKQTTAGQTKLWLCLPSKIVGDYIPGIPYSGAKTLYKKRGQLALDSVRKQAKQGWMAADSERNLQLYPKGVRNLRRILELSNISRLSRPELREWEKVKRGRDLFIKGLGSFNIKQAVRDILAEEAGTYYGPAPCDIRSIQAVGYFGSLDYRLILSSKSFMEHIKKYWSEWKSCGFEHANEIRNGLEYDYLSIERRAKYLSYSPQELYQAIQLSQEEKSALQLKADNISQAAPFKTVKLPKTTLPVKVISNFAELRKVGREFENCIGSVYYAKKALVGLSCFLLTNWEGRKYVCDLNMFTGKVEQVKGYGNSSTPVQVRTELKALGIKLAKLNRVEGV